MTWMFLNEGVALDRASDQLDGVLQELEARLYRLSVDAEIAASLYLMFIEAADQRVSNLFADPSVVGGFQTERYWHIRAMGLETQRPIPLIESEVRFQLNRLSKISAQMKHYRRLLHLDENESALLLDTNVLIHGRMFNEVPWQELASAKRAKILLPLVVLDELDNLKDRDNDFAKRARAVIRMLDPYLSGAAVSSAHKVRQEVTVQFLDEPTGHQRLGRVDDEIVRQSVYFASSSPERFTIVSQDRGMRIRANGVGLRSTLLPSPFLTDKAQKRAAE
ncbi:hypothetical protein C5B96_04440 [Subtercola sp. Z020]|uniref:PIN domain-containing protein n=1 Tax=Subtercola sp. Z020 TaxID=2080582 RepID=UPI000CE887D0|nr:PIN domain-containing protein [Subtercola sp. Z020]PPF87148.1 hypothetical protein C5B96_04440 [Subtercola sp. Z020]